MMDTAMYLKRIGYEDATDVSDHVLASLHKHHVYKVPFENLDVYYKRIFDIDLENIYRKVVIDQRGGFCYELNLLFNWLLQELGFSSRIIAARIINEQGVPGPAFDHMSIYVKAEREYLLDVGYGDLFVTPLEIKSGIQSDGRNHFKIEEQGDDTYLLSMSSDGIVYNGRYTFSLSVVQPGDFELPCIDKQTSPDSHFVKNVICTIPTDEGRLTIFNDKFVERRGEQRMISPIDGDDNLRELLKTRFSIVIRGML
ncbi:MAG: arylamine N-acetyltransferase [Chryseolinea sp.]